MMRLFFCGDIMPGGVLPYQDNYISADLMGYMQTFDFRVGTLESAIGTGLSFDPHKIKGRNNIIYARDEDFYRVKEMGFDVVSLANNHVWDLGEDGLRNTIKVLNDNGIKFCGAGMNAEEASRPAVVEKDGLTVAFFAYCMYDSPWLGYVELATEKRAGINPLCIDKVIKDIREAKKKYDIVVVLPHWGREYQYEPLPECISMAKRMVKAGADAVFGSHTHQIQPLVRFKGKPVCFSMGNFLFPDFYMTPPRPIWYPDSIDDVRGIEEVVGYPFPIEHPLKQVWNPASRYGCTIGYELDRHNRDVSIRYVHSSSENVESFLELTPTMSYQLEKVGRIVSSVSLRMAVYGRRRLKKLLGRIHK